MAGTKTTSPRRRYSTKPAEGLREPDLTLALTCLEQMQVNGLRAAVELRGFASPDLADLLCDVIERVHTIHGAAALRLREADVIGGGPRG